MTRAEIIEQVRRNVAVMAVTDRAATNTGEVVALDGGDILETHRIPVGIRHQNGSLAKVKQLVYVRYDGDPDDGGKEVDAFPGEWQMDYVAPQKGESQLHLARVALDQFCKLHLAMPANASQQIPMACSVGSLVGKKLRGFALKGHETIEGDVFVIVRLFFMDDTNHVVTISKNAAGVMLIDDYDDYIA